MFEKLKDGYFLAEGYITEIPPLVFYSLLIPAAFPLSILSMEVYSRAIRTTAHVGGAVSSLSRCRAAPASATTSARALSDSCSGLQLPLYFMSMHWQNKCRKW